MTVWYALRSLVFYVGYTFIMVLQSTASLAIRPFVSQAFLQRFTVSACSRSVWWARVACGIRYEVEGDANVPDTPCVVLSKHQSAWETLFLQARFQPASTVAKRELLKIPFFGWGMALMEPIAIDRAQRAGALKEVIRQGTQRLRAGNHVIIFPEGTRMLPGQQGEYSAGGAMLAVRAQVPVLPVALNSGLCWPRSTLIKRPGVIRVVFGKPIDAQGMSAKALNEQVRDWIESTTATLPSAPR
ncbi:MAG: lysophospholipid acyltransferase family protein [Pseudomonadota bacterium]